MVVEYTFVCIFLVNLYYVEYVDNIFIWSPLQKLRQSLEMNASIRQSIAKHQRRKASVSIKKIICKVKYSES